MRDIVFGTQLYVNIYMLNFEMFDFFFLRKLPFTAVL